MALTLTQEMREIIDAAHFRVVHSLFPTFSFLKMEVRYIPKLEIIGNSLNNRNSPSICCTVSQHCVYTLPYILAFTVPINIWKYYSDKNIDQILQLQIKNNIVKQFEGRPLLYFYVGD